MSHSFDIVVLGAGAAGMMCAAIAGQRGARVALIDHSTKIGEKIRISGGGRCNFTNVGTDVHAFVGENPRFAKFALNDYKAADFIDLVASYRIKYHEKHRGQLFCDESSDHIIQMLKAECNKGRVQWFNPVTVQDVQWAGDQFDLQTSAGAFDCSRLVIATGGLPIAQIGATDFGLTLARQFGIATTDVRPSLVPLTFAPHLWQPFVSLAGVSLEVDIAIDEGKTQFREDLLFTHRGLSGPGILQISNYWSPGQLLRLDLAPDQPLEQTLLAAKLESRKTLANEIAPMFTKNLVQQWLSVQGFSVEADRKLAEVGDKRLRALADSFKRWRLAPSGTEGYKKAEVMRGGVSTKELSSVGMESKKIPGLHFIGEVVDITGWLGGYNFQWAWSSAAVCARAMTSDRVAAI